MTFYINDCTFKPAYKRTHLDQPLATPVPLVKG